MRLQRPDLHPAASNDVGLVGRSADQAVSVARRPQIMRLAPLALRSAEPSSRA
jgi:hypothetical protein